MAKSIPIPTLKKPSASASVPVSAMTAFVAGLDSAAPAAATSGAAGAKPGERASNTIGVAELATAREETSPSLDTRRATVSLVRTGDEPGTDGAGAAAPDGTNARDRAPADDAVRGERALYGDAQARAQTATNPNSFKPHLAPLTQSGRRLETRRDGSVLRKVTVYLEPELDRALSLHAVTTGVDRSVIVADAVARHLQR